MHAHVRTIFCSRALSLSSYLASASQTDRFADDPSRVFDGNQDGEQGTVEAVGVMIHT